MSSNEKTLFGHPMGLYVLFFTEMWERFSYYGMRAILFLYLTKSASEGALGLPEDTAGAVYGLYAASVYLLTLPGGWIADNILGQKKAIWLGGICIMIGHGVLALPATPSIFFLGLAFVAVGTGLLKANISSIVGELYPEGGAKRDAAFSIFYLGINLGSFLGMFIVGYLGEKVGWHYGFGAAAFAMFFGLINFKVNGKYLKNVGEKPNKKASYTYLYVVIALLAIAVLSVTTGMLDSIQLANSMKYIISGITVGYFIYIGFLDKSLTIIERRRVGVLFILFVAIAIFWSGFEQAATTFTIFADRHTDRDLFGWDLPASWFQNANSFFILVFSAPFAALWIWLNKRNLNPNVPVKFGLGLIQLGLGFLVMYFAAQRILDGTLAGMGWLTFTYLLHSLGELCISPVGLSSYTKLAPKKYYSQMMGLWFVGASLGNLIAGLFAGNFDEGNVDAMPGLFMQFCMYGAVAGLLMILFQKQIKNWMGGIE
ncbi:peptide MFS transporter [Arcticibacterium luteifluviistationis]|uniref:MFS transporter n=1 Tax=Arcticibacterium luteifluviistationis TaxID=1784714 RepID=A0A2Z4GCV4_9BACT|nr:peptide MFS transporter [Arcticibacterium luteifluviistationis]AWV98908.1 MFS transporter [Arcticibacterium luteifluviistationis]